MTEEVERYKPQDAIGPGIKGTLAFAGIGLFASAVQNSLARRPVGVMGVFTRTGGTIATFAAVGGGFEFTRLIAANLRQKNDSWNPTLAGFVAGSFLGMRRGTLPMILGHGALAAVVIGVYDVTGGRLEGWGKDPEVDEFDRKEALRKNRRRPIDETISQLGEGRGIYAPGYQERRKERLKANYGIDVPDSAL